MGSYPETAAAAAAAGAERAKPCGQHAAAAGLKISIALFAVAAAAAFPESYCAHKCKPQSNLDKRNTL